MGLKSEMFSGDLTFGIKVMLVWLISFGIFQLFIQSRTAKQTSSPIRDQKDWQYRGGILSGPGAMMGSI